MLGTNSQIEFAGRIGRFTSPGGDEVVFLPIPRGTFHGEDDIPAGTFHGEDDIPAGTFHGEDDIPAGTFHRSDEMPPLDDEEGLRPETAEGRDHLSTCDEDVALVPEMFFL